MGLSAVGSNPTVATILWSGPGLADGTYLESMWTLQGLRSSNLLCSAILIVPWCKGSTTDFESVCVGSNPAGTTNFGSVTLSVTKFVSQSRKGARWTKEESWETLIRWESERT